jgi:hypothetical protein
VLLPDGSHRRLDALQIGDVVQAVDESTGKLVWSPVYMFFDATTAATRDFLRIQLRSIKQGRLHMLHITPNHFVYAGPPASSSLAHARLVHAGTVHMGDTMWVRGEGGRVVESEVVDVERVPGEGLFSPHTLAGSIVVDGVMAHSSGDLALPGGRYLSTTLGIHPKVYFVSAGVCLSGWELRRMHGIP